MTDFDSYFLPISSHDVDLGPWKELLPDEFRIIRITLFADVVLRDGDGAVHMLQVAADRVERIAESEEEFWHRIREDEEGWQLRPLADRCQDAGKTLGEGECYAFTTLPFLGGEYVEENVWISPWRAWFAFTGDIHLQTKDLPDGAKVELRIAD